MNDSSGDRLAPVSYLPWATPHGDHPAGGRRADRAGVGAAGAGVVSEVDAETDAAIDADVETTVELDPEIGDPAEFDPDIDDAADIDEVGMRDAVSAIDEASASPTRSRADAVPRGRASDDRGRSRGFDRRGARGAPRLSIVGDGEQGDETGAERDDRIDRLVVSRLRRSALSIAEVRAVLAEHGLDDAEVDEWIERYERLGYLDDARLAEQLTHSHGTRRGRGSTAILHELDRRGIGGDVARAAVDGIDAEAELVNATAVAERRARQLRGLDHATAERRLTAFLMRRGYPSGVVREAVTAALTADGS
jgi:regulatory protein